MEKNVKEKKLAFFTSLSSTQPNTDTGGTHQMVVRYMEE